MSFKERLALYEREKAERKAARMKRRVEKKRTIEPLTKEKIDIRLNNGETLQDIFLECIKRREESFLNKKTLVNNRVAAQDLNLVTGLMLEDFETYKPFIKELCQSGEYEEKYITSVICMKTGFNTKMAVDNIRYMARRKKEFGETCYEAREIISRYNQKRIPPYDGFDVDYTYIKK